MDDDEQLTQATQGTQGVVDPRRVGRNNSGLSTEDVSDVMCILHPSTPAAFQLVNETARRAPQHILQDVSNMHTVDYQNTPSMLENEETFVLNNSDGQTQALDLAFRFSSRTMQPSLGFTFGRNSTLCDIAIVSDAHKRVSNQHFGIYMNDLGVLMIKDMSTNGTMVDEILLRGKHKDYERQRMLNHGTILQILSQNPKETIKFIVRIPSRTGHLEEYERKFHAYIARMTEAEIKYYRDRGEELLPAPKFAPDQPRQQNATIKAPIVQNSYGMHWNGGDMYNVVGQIGKGAFASVYQLATKHDGQLYAAKELEKRKFMKNGVLDRKLENEMIIMQSIEHPSIVQYHGYEDVTHHLYIIMEFVACGDLQQYLNKYGPLPESMAKQMAIQVFDALDYLHSKRITHRDIKPDNILLASLEEDNFVIKLSDFGLSKVVNDNDTFLKTFCGTLLYCAPEVFPHYDAHVAGKGTKRPRKPPPRQSTKFHSYSQAVDIWSFGAVLWYSLCQKPPFEGVSDNTGRGMFDKIMMTPLDAADLVRQGVSDEAVALLVQMLNTDPAARPSAEYCIRHKWFGHLEPLIQRESQPQRVLGDIEEDLDAEEEAHEEPNVASLSLYEGRGKHNSEISLDSDDMNFFDPRQSKRFKLNDVDYREREDELVDSSVELYGSIPIVQEEDEQQLAPVNSATKPKPPKLFGEISQSDLQSSAFGRRANGTVGNQPSSTGSGDAYGSFASQQNAQQTSQRQDGPSPSLLGAESLVRELNMDSSYSHDSETGAGNEPITRGTPPSFQQPSQKEASQETPNANPDITPKPAQSAPFSRQIKIPKPPSFWYEPDDPSTHNLEYASKASGHDYMADPLYKDKETSLPTTMNTSKRSSSEYEDETVSHQATEENVRGGLEDGSPGPRPALGRLISTSNSFARIVIDLNSRNTTWGRALGNSHVYPNKSETRVPKTGISMFFYAPGIEDIPEGEDFTDLRGLYCGILTHASNGLHINGVKLEKAPPEMRLFGKVHTGDEIEVWPPSKYGRAGLKFVADIYHGDGKEPRHHNAPRFKVVQIDLEAPASSRRKEKDTVAGAGDENDA